jgi:hypothetical protein
MHPTVRIGARPLWTPLAPGRLEVALLALPPLLFAFLPRPSLGGAQYVAIPGMAAILSVFLLLFVGKTSRFSRDLLVLILLLLLVSAFATLSFLFNIADLRQSAITELVRPAVFAAFLLYGYYAASLYGGERVQEGLLLAARLLLVGQAVIAVTQLVDMPVFDAIYSGEKTRPLGSLVRITGSLANPNMFGWVVAQASVIIVLLGRRAWPWLLLSSFLIVVSGSRTLLLAFPFMPILAYIWRRGGGLTEYLRGAATAVAALAGVIGFVFFFGDIFPYLGQIRSAAFSGSLQSINSFASRIMMWESAYTAFSGGGPMSWLFGLGSRSSTRVLDNDYFYVLFRLGIIGFLLHGGMFLYIGRLLTRARNFPAAVGLQYLVFSLALGLLFETLGGWNFPLLLFFLVGLAVGLRDSEVGPTAPDGRVAPFSPASAT